MHRIVFTEIRLRKMNMSNGKCHQCNADEDLCHLFFACHKSYTFLTEVFKMLHIIEPESILNDDYKLSLSNIIFGFSASLKFSELFNFVLLYSKWIIWTERNIKKKTKTMIIPSV